MTAQVKVLVGTRKGAFIYTSDDQRQHLEVSEPVMPGWQVYHMVAEELDVPPAAICMIAAHVWDTIGAQSVGCSGALVARPGNASLPVHGLPQPQVVAPDLPGVAAQMIRLWR